jgi:hypothetical protein
MMDERQTNNNVNSDTEISSWRLFYRSIKLYWADSKIRLNLIFITLFSILGTAFAFFLGDFIRAGSVVGTILCLLGFLLFLVITSNVVRKLMLENRAEKEKDIFALEISIIVIAIFIPVVIGAITTMIIKISLDDPSILLGSYLSMIFMFVLYGAIALFTFCGYHMTLLKNKIGVLLKKIVNKIKGGNKDE